MQLLHSICRCMFTYYPLAPYTNMYCSCHALCANFLVTFKVAQAKYATSFLRGTVCCM